MNYKNLDFQELKELSEDPSKLQKLSTIEILELMSNITNSNFEQLILLEKKKKTSPNDTQKEKLTSKQLEYISMMQNILKRIKNRI